MADTDATRALFRELLGMTNGSTAGGRGAMSIPDDIMDSLAGDSAQEAIARDNLLTEMRRSDNREHDGRFVSLDLMEMDANDVDSFLSTARKKIIKRSKPTRQACCAKIGGVLDQLMGAGGGDHLELQGTRDRGSDEPTGDVDQVAEASGYTYEAADREPSHEMKKWRAAWSSGDDPWKRAHKLGHKVYGVSVHDAIRNVHKDLPSLAREMGAHEQDHYDRSHPVESTGDVDQVAETADYVAKDPSTGRHLRSATKAEIGAHERANAGKRRGFDTPTSVDKVTVDTWNGPGGAHIPGRFIKSDVDLDLLDFIAEEFFHFEHDENCEFSDPNFTLHHDPLAEAKWIQGAIKKPGALRSHFNVREGEEIPVAKARKEYAALSKKAEGEGTLSGPEMKIFKRLQLFLKVLKPVASARQEEAEEDHEFQPSQYLSEAGLKKLGRRGELKIAKMPAEGSARQSTYGTDLDTAQARWKEQSRANRYVAGNRGDDRDKAMQTASNLFRSDEGYRARQRGKARSQEENYTMDVSNTAHALSSFMEASHNAYAAANAGGGKGSPDKGMMAHSDEAGQLSLKTRDDNSAYSTELMPAKGGGKKTAGQPGSLSTRGVDRGDPIGEAVGPTDWAYKQMNWEREDKERAAAKPTAKPSTNSEEPKKVSETANALANFMESTSQAAVAKEKLAMRSDDAGQLAFKERAKQPYGLPPKAAKGSRGGLDTYDSNKARYEKDADPIGGTHEEHAAGRRMKK